MRRLALVLAMVLPVTLGGCGDSTSPESVAGTYELQSIDGDPLPVSTSEGDVRSGFVRLNANGTFQASHTYDLPTSGTMRAITINGAYTRTGSNVVLSFIDLDGGGVTTANATWTGDQLTIAADPGIWLYVR
jgi:hypothetical protein